MAIELSYGGPHWMLRLSGTVDISGVDRLHAAACEAAKRGGSGAVDLRHVDSLDASAVQVLLCLRQAIADAGGTMHVENTPPRISELWERTGITACGLLARRGPISTL